MRAHDWTVSLLAACALLAACGEPSGGGGARPNIVLYVVDTLRADGLAPYGNTVVETPALDALAAGGTLFERAYAQSSWTRAAMASMLTSTYPEVHGAVRRYDVLPETATLLSERLRAHGYRTGLITANPNIGSSFGFDQGFDQFVELYEERGAEFVKVRELDTSGVDVAAAVTDWIDAAAEPYFLAVLSIDPHSPYQAPAAFDRYGGDYAGAADGSHDFINRADLSDADKQRVRSLYLAEVAFSDAVLGDVLDHLERSGAAQRTVFVYTSDHGEEFWEHGLRGHGRTLFDESLHVPLVVRYPPSVPAGGRIARAVEIVDLAPTLLELAGLPLPADLDGRGLFEEAGADERTYASLALGGARQLAVRSGPWKLIWDAKTDQRVLYDLRDGGGEARDVSEANPARADELVRLAKEQKDRNLERARALHGEHAQQSVDPGDLPEEQRRALDALGYAE